MGAAIVDGKLYPDVNFVDSPDKADLEVWYDKIEWSKESRSWVYYRHGRVVAAASRGENE